MAGAAGSFTAAPIDFHIASETAWPSLPAVPGSPV